MRACSAFLARIGTGLTLVKPMRAAVHVPPLMKPETLATETDFVFTTKYGNFDLIGEFTGVGRYEQAIVGAIPVKMLRRPIRVLSLPNLMAAKLSTGRPKDKLVHDELAIVKKLAERLNVISAEYAMRKKQAASIA